MSTIAAISTPFGRGGIAVIRISGENALKVAEKMFITACGLDLSEVEGGRAVYGRIVSDGEQIDDGIATVFCAPRSFTGEDTVEISCHGGILLTERVLKTAFDCGALPAEPGEFTQRVFMNGKIDLSGAEAVIGLIDAENEEKLRLCASHASGVLKKRCDSIFERILHLVSSVYVKLDYPEEDLAEVSDREFAKELGEIIRLLSETEATYKHGKAVAEGVKTAIIGKPNTGKSSLLNALVGEEKAIVTSVAGTTRDVIEEKINAGKVTLRLFDTAGIRASADEVERIGIERALAKADEAELIIALFDATKMPDEQDERIMSIIKDACRAKKPLIYALNKIDAADENAVLAIRGAIKRAVDEAFSEADILTSPNEIRLPTSCGEINAVHISAKTGEGVDELKKLAEAFFCEGDINYRDVAVVANARQHAAICEAKNAVKRALMAFESGMGADVCGLDLEAAIAALGQIDGRSVSDKVTDQIFHNFCVGK